MQKLIRGVDGPDGIFHHLCVFVTVHNRSDYVLVYWVKGLAVSHLAMEREREQKESFM